MEKRAVVIRTGGVVRAAGDAGFAGAIINGAIKPLEEHELATVKAELARMRNEDRKHRRELAAVKAENAKLGVRKVRDRKYFNGKMRKLERRRKIKPPCKAAQITLVTWTMAYLALKVCFDRLAGVGRKAS